MAIVAIIALAIDAHQLSTTVSALQEGMQAQNARLTDQLAQATADNNQHLAAVAQQASETATAAEEHARAEVRKTGANLTARLAEQQQVAGEVDQLKQGSSDANTKLTEISADVSCKNPSEISVTH